MYVQYGIASQSLSPPLGHQPLIELCRAYRILASGAIVVVVYRCIHMYNQCRFVYEKVLFDWTRTYYSLDCQPALTTAPRIYSSARAIILCTECTAANSHLRGWTSSLWVSPLCTTCAILLTPEDSTRDRIIDYLVFVIINPHCGAAHPDY